MEITARTVRRVRQKTAQPKYAFDHKLAEMAARADQKTAQGIYASIQNPATQHVYRYLTEFTAALLRCKWDKPLPQIRVLDWGGGKGYVAYFLQQLGVCAELYETDAYPHRQLWKHCRLAVKTSDGARLPYDSKTFDAVIGFGVLEHVPYEHEALKELNRVLKDDGLLFCFNLPNRLGYIHRLSWWSGVRYHDRLYGRKETQMLLKRAGFTTIGKPWYRQLLPKTHYHYPYPAAIERLDLALTNHTPLKYLATSIEFVARKHYAYTAVH